MDTMPRLWKQNQTNDQARHRNQTFTSLLSQVWNRSLDRYTKTAFTDCHRARRLDAEPTTIEEPSTVVGSASFGHSVLTNIVVNANQGLKIRETRVVAICPKDEGAGWKEIGL